MKIKEIRIKGGVWEVLFDNGTTKEFHTLVEYKRWVDNNFHAIEEHLREGVLKREDYRGKRR